jgi:hypothetical protein
MELERFWLKWPENSTQRIYQEGSLGYNFPPRNYAPRLY